MQCIFLYFTMDLVRLAPYLIIDRNENKAVRDRSTCIQWIVQHTNCSAEKTSFQKLHKTVLKVISCDNYNIYNLYTMHTIVKTGRLFLTAKISSMCNLIWHLTWLRSMYNLIWYIWFDFCSGLTNTKFLKNWTKLSYFMLKSRTNMSIELVFPLNYDNFSEPIDRYLFLGVFFNHKLA